MSSSLPHSAPSAHRIDAAGIEHFLDAIDNAPAVEPHSLLVLRHGHVVASGWWAPYQAARPHMLYSLSKSFTATALGLAIEERRLRLDDPVVEFFPDLSIEHPRTRSLRIHHLATMSTGHTRDMWRDAFEADPVEPVRAFLDRPPDQNPGTVFAYNQPATYTLATILQRVTGNSLTEYLRPRLFDPIGVDVASWQQYPAGRDVGFVGMFTTTEAIARFGELYLRRGLWGDQRVLPESWVDAASRSQISTGGEPHPDWQQGYGFQFWRSRHGYRGDGAYGQFCLILPDQDAVVAYTGATLEMQLVLDFAWQHLIPAFDQAGSLAADRRLAQRMETLALPAVPSGLSRPFEPTSFVSAAGAGPALTGIEITADEPSAVLREAGTELRIPIGRGEWAVSEEDSVPIAASGGWTDESTLRFDVIFLETPHRLRITCDRNTGTFDATWAIPPLQPLALRDLRAPRATADQLSTGAPVSTWLG